VLLKSDITDPVIGFFMIRSEVADKVAARLSGVGTKIRIDLLASAPGPLSVTELPYRFRGRNSGSSKLDWFTVLEFLALLVEKVSGGYLPSKFLLFGTVGASGMIIHLVSCAFCWLLPARVLLVLSRLRRRWFGTTF
jgi:dolichol-phosphate mannosyltransferase